MVNTKKFSEFSEVDLADSTTEYVGIGSGVNIRGPKTVEWTTATRPTPPFNGLMGYNTTLSNYEFYSGPLADWVQFEASNVAILPGNENDVAFYPADGTTLGPIASANNAVLVTDGTGVPSLSTTLPAGLTIPGYANAPVNTNITSMTGLTGTLRAPTSISSSAGLPLLTFAYTTNAVNYWTVASNVTGAPPLLIAQGSDPNVAAQIESKGGLINFFDSTSTNGASVRVLNADGLQFTGLKKADGAATSVTFTLPDADGSANFIMKTDGAANLSLANGSQIAGTATNDNASAGNIGELITSNIPQASAVSFSATTSTNITSISLTPGDWDVWGNINYVSLGGATPSQLYAWTSSTSATPPDASVYNSISYSLTTVAGTPTGLSAPYRRYSLSSTTTIYLTGFITGDTGTACGSIYARRAR